MTRHDCGAVAVRVHNLNYSKDKSLADRYRKSCRRKKEVSSEVASTFGIGTVIFSVKVIQ